MNENTTVRVAMSTGRRGREDTDAVVSLNVRDKLSGQVILDLEIPAATFLLLQQGGEHTVDAWTPFFNPELVRRVGKAMEHTTILDDRMQDLAYTVASSERDMMIANARATLIAREHGYETGEARRTNRMRWEIIARRYVEPAEPWEPYDRVKEYLR